MVHLDLTIDFETCSLSANAAVMQVAVVPWNRFAEGDPFIDDTDPFVGHVDLRTCVVDGFDFDPDTIRWWSERSMKAKEAVTDGLPESIRDVLTGVIEYIQRLKYGLGADSICLWCQGEDVDIAILRNLCRKYGIDLEKIVPHTSFRDCRSLILESALTDAVREGNASYLLSEPAKAYERYESLPEIYAGNSGAHDALYDAVRSSWYTWQALKKMRTSNV